ncbi:MAG: DUF3800 domain-containing protein [Candidatus Korobacteraceae bacterium]
MLLKAYIDDSWDGSREVVTVAGAYLAYPKQWNPLRDAWRKALKRGGINFFHSTEYYSLRGEFLQFRDPVKYPKPAGSDAAKAIRAELFKIIQKSKIAGFAVALPIGVYEDVLRDEPYAAEILPPKDQAFKIAVQELFALLARTLIEKKWAKRIAFVYDRSDEFPAIYSVFQGFTRLNPTFANYMTTIVPLDDKRYPQLQAADVMAHMGRERYTEWLNDTSQSKPELQSRLADLGVARLVHVTHDRLVALVRHEAKRRGLQG